jgi:hypothetical protein
LDTFLQRSSLRRDSALSERAWDLSHRGLCSGATSDNCGELHNSAGKKRGFRNEGVASFPLSHAHLRSHDNTGIRDMIPFQLSSGELQENKKIKMEGLRRYFLRFEVAYIPMPRTMPMTTATAA